MNYLNMAGDTLIGVTDGGGDSALSWFWYALLSATLTAASVAIAKATIRSLLQSSTSGQAQIAGVATGLAVAVGAWIAGGRALGAIDASIPLVAGIGELLFWALIVLTAFVGGGGFRLLDRV